jgi:hypothetical protein
LAESTSSWTDTFFVLHASSTNGGTPLSECLEGDNVTYGMGFAVDLIRAGNNSGYLVRASDGRHVRFRTTRKFISVRLE